MWKSLKNSWLGKLFLDLYNSFFNDKNGFSARKLTACAITALVIHLCKEHTTNENLYDIVLLLVIFICVCLGMVTVDNLIQWKTGGTGTKTEEITESNNKKVTKKEEVIKTLEEENNNV